MKAESGEASAVTSHVVSREGWSVSGRVGTVGREKSFGNGVGCVCTCVCVSLLSFLSQFPSFLLFRGKGRGKRVRGDTYCFLFF